MLTPRKNPDKKQETIIESDTKTIEDRNKAVHWEEDTITIRVRDNSGEEDTISE